MVFKSKSLNVIFFFICVVAIWGIYTDVYYDPTPEFPLQVVAVGGFYWWFKNIDD